jgi:hypothetical protein
METQRSLTEAETSRLETYLGRSRLFFAFAVVFAATTAALGSFVVTESDPSDAAIGGTLCFVLAGLWAFSAYAIRSKQRMLRDDIKNATAVSGKGSISKTQIVKGKVIAIFVENRRLILEESLAGSPGVEVGDEADITWLPLSGYILEFKAVPK